MLLQAVNFTGYRLIRRTLCTKQINQGLTLENIQYRSKVSYHPLLRRESLVMRYVILVAQWPKNCKYHGQNS